jgi:hypothetical protein
VRSISIFPGIRQRVIGGRLISIASGPTRIHQTGSGGLHLLFRHNEFVRGWAGKIALGVDTRGNGGYVIWWPAYGCSVLSDAPIAPWPNWLLEKLKPKPRPQAAARRISASGGTGRMFGLIRTVAEASEGQRNSVLHWAGCRAGEMVTTGEIDETSAFELLMRAAARCGIDREGKKTESTLRSAIRTGLNSVRRS